MTLRASLAPALSSLVLIVALLLPQPSAAEKGEPSWQWEGSAAEEGLAKGLDAVLLRPFGAVRVIAGAVLMIPAALFAAPGGREGIDAAYEVLIDAPIEYAFKRPLGDF